jgi:hypothetical protein
MDWLTRTAIGFVFVLGLAPTAPTQFRIVTDAASAAADAVVDRIDAGSGPGTLVIFGSTCPSTADAADSGTTLAVLTFGDPAFGSAVDGVATANAITADSSANATGTAMCFRAKDSDGNVIFQGAMTTSGGGGEIILSSTSVTAGQSVAITSLTYTQPTEIAGIIDAGSCSTTDVQTAITSASNGDTVRIPDGSCTWTSGITLNGSKYVHIQGETEGGVVLTNNASGSLFSITDGTSGSIEISNLAFAGGSGTAATVTLYNATGGYPTLLHDNAWSGSIHAIRAETNRGVIYSNTIDTNGLDKSFVQCKPEGLLLASWESAHTIGTADTTGTSNLYVEDNTITEVPLQAFDSDGNCRIVVRYNTFQDSAYTSHGPDTGPYGNRHTELYNNTFAFTPNGCSAPVAIMDYFIFIRGGVWVITDNVIPDLVSCYLGDKNQIKMQIQNLRRNSGDMPCYAGSYPMPRQIGAGHNGSTYITDPVYIWDNTGGGSVTPSVENYSPDECGGGQAITTFVQASRDFYVGSARPSYTKYTYPHPLR